MEANPTLLRMKYARVIEEYSRSYNVDILDAMRIFYSSRLFDLMSNGIADMHCFSDIYLADELALEQNRPHNS